MPIYNSYSVNQHNLHQHFKTGEEIILIKGNNLITLWPLNIFALPKIFDSEITIFKDRISQIYSRIGEYRLQYTPIYSDEICSSESDEKAFEAFTRLFRLDNNCLPIKTDEFEIKGIENDIRKESDRLLGRTQELEIVRKLIRDKQYGLLWLFGTAGIGKTYIVSKICVELLDDASDNMLVLPFRFKKGDDRCSTTKFYHFALERLEAWGPNC